MTAPYSDAELDAAAKAAPKPGFRCRHGWHKFSGTFPYPCARCGRSPEQCSVCHSWHDPSVITFCSVTRSNPWM